MKSFLLLFWVLLFPLHAFSQTGTIEGSVYSNTSQEPLVGVNVHLIEINVSQKTDATGTFAFRDVPEGDWTLSVTSPTSPSAKQVSIVVTAGKTVQPKIYLEEIMQLEGIEVKERRLAKTVSRKSMKAEEIMRLPGTAGDALRALPSIPGIGVANDFSGALYIRGGSDDDNLYYFDRIPIAYPYHFGGLVSSLSSEIIERIDVYAGGYGAEFGVDSQAVIDIYSYNSSPGGLHGKLNLNLLYSEGMLQGKIADNGFWYAAGRRSYADFFIGSLSFETGEITAFPRFWDYQLKTGYELNDKHQLFINAFSSRDRFSLKLDGEDIDQDLQGNLDYQSGFSGAGIHLRSLLTNRLTSFLSLTYSDFLFDTSIGTVFSIEVDAPNYVLREDLSYALSPKHQLESGLILAIEPGKVTGKGGRVPDEGEDEYDFRFQERKIFDDFIRGQRLEGYLQDRYELLPFLSAVFGIRFDYFNLIDELSIQPRGSLLFELPSGAELQFSYGLYNQTPESYRLSPAVGNPNLQASLANHYIVELKRQLSPQTDIKLAGYYKHLDRLVTFDEQYTYLNQGTGYAQGTEIFLRHYHEDRFFTWISYAYALSKRRDRPTEPYRYYSFDQTHVATLAASYNLTPTWEIGAKWQYRTGNPYTPLNTQNPSTVEFDPRNGETIYIPNYLETNSARLPAYHRLDLRVSKTFRFSNWKLGFFVELLNAYNRKNLLNFNYNDDYTEKEKINQFPIIPYLGITAEF